MSASTTTNKPATAIVEPPPAKKLKMTSQKELEEEKNNKPKPFHSRSNYVQKFEMKNKNFETYYKKQGIITNEDEWNVFLKTLQTELPTSFRFNPSSKLHKIFKNKLENDEFDLIKAENAKIIHEGIIFKRPYPLNWFPHELVWQCDFPKRYLNKHKEYLSTFRKFLVEANEFGIISRQETVSMIPPLFFSLFMSSTDNILDMCAAPGNKTGQLLELLHYNFDGTKKTKKTLGMIVANDADEKRAHVMVHQLKRLSLNNFVVTNKLAQCIPRIKNLTFDGILCDVPCSSDGTLRKSPDLWKKWSTAYGNGLHKIQLAILLHAIHLVKPGGKVIYSTCTFNPIENEAVISSALLKANHFYQKKNKNNDIQINVELMNMNDKFKDLKRNCGLNKWCVWDKNMKNDCFYEKYDDVSNDRKQYVFPTMFAPQTRDECKSIKNEINDYLHLDRCMRFLPHYHNTGGFFVAVIHKNKKENKKENKTENKTENKVDSMDIDKNEEMLDDDSLFKMEKREFDKRHVWNDNVPYFKMEKLNDYKTEINKLVTFYGLKTQKEEEKNDDDDDDDDDIPYFDFDEILIRGINNPRSLWFVPKSIASVISNVDNHQLRIVQSGCRAFVRHDTKVTQHACKWRLTQDGCVFLAQHITKQHIRLPLELYLILAFVGKLTFDEIIKIDDGKYSNLIENVMKKQCGGPAIVTIKKSDNTLLLNKIWNSLSCWKSMKRIDLMVKKQQIVLLQNHLKDVYKKECTLLKEKFPQIAVNFDDEKNRQNFNKIKNKKKNKNKHKNKKQRDWKHRKTNYNNNKNSKNNKNNNNKMNVDKNATC